MTLAVISDIHGNIDALEAVLADIDARGINRIVNLGDCLSGPFDALATAERLMALDIPTVSGNHDRQLIDRPKSDMGVWETWTIDTVTDRHLDWLRSLPFTLDIDGVFLCHATPADDEKNWLDKRGANDRIIARDLVDVEAFAAGITQAVMLCGHTHTPRVVRISGGRMIVNPGAVGCPAYLDTRAPRHFIHQTGAPDARYAILREHAGTWAADLISVPYDATRMADMAKAKGADSWADAVTCLLYTSPSPRDRQKSRMPSSA